MTGLLSTRTYVAVLNNPTRDFAPRPHTPPGETIDDLAPVPEKNLANSPEKRHLYKIVLQDQVFILST